MQAWWAEENSLKALKIKNVWLVENLIEVLLTILNNSHSPLNLGSSIWWYTPKNALLKYTSSCSTSCLFTGGVSVCSCTEDAGCLSFALDGYDQWSGGLPRLWELLQPQWLQRLLLFGPDPQHRAPGPALRRSAHCTRPWLHVLLGARHKFTIFSCCLLSQHGIFILFTFVPVPGLMHNSGFLV